MIVANGVFRTRKNYLSYLRKRYRMLAVSNPRLVLCSVTCLAFIIILQKKKSFTPSLNVRLKKLPDANSTECLRSRPLYIFLHLHKTGGNSLKDALHAFAKKNKFNLFHTCHRSHADSRIQAWYFHREKDDRGTDCNLEDLIQLTAAQRADIDMIMGHQFFGVHQLFPNRQAFYFTFVRHPLPRKISHYHHFESRGAARTDGDLYQYLLHRNRNYMVKRLSTDGVVNEVWTDIRSNMMDRDRHSRHAALVEAKRHLVDYFFFVGLYERYAQSTCMLSALLNSACGRRGVLGKRVKTGQRNMTRIRRNVRVRPVSKLIPENIRNNTLRMEDVDIELYNFAKSLYVQGLHEMPECHKSL